MINEKKAIILIVDDNPINLNVFVDYLKKSGFKTLVATTGERAIRQIEYIHPDLILLDVMMPGMDGFETCSHIKKNETTKDIPIIFMTALSDVINKLKGFEMGGVDYITKPFQSEETLARINTHLTITKLQKQLIEKNIQLKELNNSLEQIIYITSHDFRSPLTGIQGLSELLEERYKKLILMLENEDIIKLKELIPTLKKDTSKTIKYILQSVYKLNSLLTGLVEVSRIGRIELTIEELDMNELISNILDTFKYHIEDKKVNIILSELPNCYGDKLRINQIFSNLIGNALKYLDNNRIGIIKIYAYKELKQIVYCVEDNGIGIPIECQEEIFDIFRQLDPETEGEGLGLAMISKIIILHNGKIWVESEEGKGSKFCISLQYQ